MGFTPITTLHEPWWERQPDESLTAYTRFCRYRDHDPAACDDNGQRSYQAVATSFRISDRAVREQAKAHRWADRAAAHDDQQKREADARHHDWIHQQANQLAEAQIRASHEMTHLVRYSVREHITHGTALEADEIPKVADAAAKLGQSAQRAPEQARAIYRQATSTDTTSTSSAYEIEIPELRNLGPDGARQRLADMLEGVQRITEYTKRETGEQG